MDDLVSLFDLLFYCLRHKFVLFGYELSWWEIIVWLFVAALFIYAIRGIFD